MAGFHCSLRLTLRQALACMSRRGNGVDIRRLLAVRCCHRGPCLLSLGLGFFFDGNCPCSCVQLSCYDQAKQLVLSTGHLSDNILTHFISSVIAVSAQHG